MYTYDIEQLLKNDSAVKLKPQGYSMYPLFLPGRDEAVIEHCVPSELHRGDVILYRRVQGILVLHRICRITGWLYLVGTIRPKWKTSFPGADSWKLTGVVTAMENRFLFRIQFYGCFLPSGSFYALSARFSGR